MLVVAAAGRPAGAAVPQEWSGLVQPAGDAEVSPRWGRPRTGYGKVYVALLLAFGIVAWWLVLTHRSQAVGGGIEPPDRPAGAEIEVAPPHRPALRQRRSRRWPGRARGRPGEPGQDALHQQHQPRVADTAQQHLGYASCCSDGAWARARRTRSSVILRGGDHLLSLIEGTLDIARIEAGKLTLQQGAVDLRAAAR